MHVSVRGSSVPSPGGVLAMAETESWVVARVEGDVVVLEVAKGRTLNLPKRLLPLTASEGQMFSVRVTRGAAHALVELTVDEIAMTTRGGHKGAPLLKPGRGDKGGKVTL